MSDELKYQYRHYLKHLIVQVFIYKLSYTINLSPIAFYHRMNIFEFLQVSEILESDALNVFEVSYSLCLGNFCCCYSAGAGFLQQVDSLNVSLFVLFFVDLKWNISTIYYGEIRVKM